MAKKKVKKSDLQKQQALENRWAFDMAHRLMDDAEFDQSKAFRQAYLVLELLGQLGNGVVTFEYTKKDGHQWYGGVNIERLAYSCDDWEEVELRIEN